jgi:multisubunit Na+/H+ antiporter MnhB subunit
MTTLLTRDVARLLLAPTVIVALAILVKGYAQAGDGFAAGMIAGLGVALQYVTGDASRIESRLPVRWAAAAAVGGLAFALLVAASALVRGEPLLTHAPAPGAEVVHLGTLELITAMLFDVGIFLLVLGTVVGAVRAAARVNR